MASQRIQRTNEDIQRTMSVLLRQVKDPRVQQGIISITAVDTTGDLRYSKIFLSVLGLRNEKDFLKGLSSASGYLRRELGSKLSLRYTPELIFKLDKSIEHGSNISKLLHNMDEVAEAEGEGALEPEHKSETEEGGERRRACDEYK